MQGDLFENSFGDIFIGRKLKNQLVENTDLQQEQTKMLLDRLGEKKAMSSGDNATDNKKYLILGGMAIMMVFALLIIK